MIHTAFCRRVLALALTGATLLSLTACGQEPTDGTTEPTVATQPATEATVPTEATVTETVPETVPEPVETAPPETEPTEPTEPQILYEYRVLHEVNPDVIGWMTIPGTVIDYPVVQSLYERNFYLRRNYLKQNATCGTLYARERCDVFKPADNITIYGHKMGNGTMFADLHNYKQKSFWEENKYIHFDTIYEHHTYEIFAAFRSTADLSIGFRYHIFDDAADQAEYDTFVATCKSLADYDTGITPQLGEKLITLSTCDKSIDQGLYVVVARMIE